MGAFVPQPVPCAKGAICYCLDELSRGPGARARLTKLRKAIAALAPSYAGLAEVFDKYLVAYEFTSVDSRRRILEHLRACWFDANSRTAYFPKTPVSRIYAEGVLRTLDLSLKGRGRAVPINAWWVLDTAGFKMLVLADVKGGVTIGGNVTLLVMTPRPKAKGRAVPPWILGTVAEAYTTEQQRGGAATKRVRDMS